MKVLILAGGFGTRISEETRVIPKPMIPIGDKPILWHIMKQYSAYGFNDFVILCGYKGNVIKEFFQNYYLFNGDVTFDLSQNSMTILRSESEPWKVSCLDTGLNTLTGGRIKRAESLVGHEPFFLTYGDGVSDINIGQLLENHIASKKNLTMSAVQPLGRFGAVDINENNEVLEFQEKPEGDGRWINGGFFVCEPQVFSYITQGDESIFERAPLEKLAKEGQINAFKHSGFWKCMDTLADKEQLSKLWDKNQAPWKIW